jgi:hypothetical protein
MSTTQDWTRPTPVTDVEIAFPANALDYMPSYADCKDALHAMEDRGRRWIDFQQAWFYDGLAADTKIDLRDGIDSEQAIRHLKVIQGSYASKHEHKEAAVAYLASLWFDDVRDYKR